MIKSYVYKKIKKRNKNCDYSSKLHNILKRAFNPLQPNAAWCTDITYIWTQEDGFVYLTSIMDLYSRKIIRWKLSKTMEVEDILECLETAWITLLSFIVIVAYNLTKGMKCSYSRKGNPWDNACIKSFHSLIKREWLKRQRINDYEMVYHLVFEYVETFYNTVRIHSHCGYLSPNGYENEYDLKNNLK